MEYFLDDLHVALPGKINEYDPDEQRAEIQPLVKRRISADDGNEIVESIPPITDVPVIFPRSGNFFLSFPIKKGDHVMLVFQERSIDNFLSAKKGQEVDPGEFRRHDLTDAVAYPGLYPWSAAIRDAHPDNLVIGNDGGLQTHYKASEITLGEENPIEKVLLGTIFRTSQATKDASVKTQWTALASALTALATACTATGVALTAAGNDPVLIGLAPVAAASLVTAGASSTAEGVAATAGATAATAAAAAITAFESTASGNQDFQSNVIKVKR